MGTAANVIIEKPQGIFYADVATALPTITGTLGSAITMTGWTDVGFIDPEGKIKISFGANLVKVRPIGMEGNLKGIATQKMATIEFNRLEDAIGTLELALGGAAVASNAMPDGGDAEIIYKALAIVTTNYVYHFKRVAPNHELAKEIADDSAGLMPYVLETYVEEAATAGERQWKILERTAGA